MSETIVLSARAMKHVAKNFLEWNPGLMDPDHVHDRCMDYCDAWLAYLRSWAPNHEGEVISGCQFGEAPELRHLDPPCRVFLRGHFGVLIDGQVWDWTARQFDPAAPVPKVTPLAQWRQEWPEL